MDFVEDNLDLILVPAGLLIMFTYHLYLIYRVLRYPATTAIGYENHNRMQWAECMMKGGSSTSVAVSVLSTNTTTAIYLATFTLTVSTLIGAWVGSSTGYLSKNVFIIGDTSPNTVTLKYISMIVALMLAFGSFVQSARYCVEADFYISTPSAEVPVSYVQSALLRANNFWQLGYRFLYFAMAFLFWSFGPIPMFASCLLMVVLLSILDTNSTKLHWYQMKPKFPVKKVVEEM
ncbi:hypothetical protein NE237_002039 [Protea cynaroides]|uniref:Uncharacterized protein n=1 Tax=Protea cynaroides TaxID=273540 RepID=A0A9Q0QYP2_9MAGN|nr:hypothetical protein NE237_002039 [Protea cynaroides]